MMKFLKFLIAAAALGAVVELIAWLMGRGTATILVTVSSLVILFICAIVYYRASARVNLATRTMATPLELSINPLNAPVILKTNTNSSTGGSGSSVTPINRVTTTPEVAPKSTMKSSMM